MIDLSSLNPRQREAVTHGSGPLLVLAGAGSGKTRVITYRIAWLVADARVPADSVMAVTFTNKAANEMLERAARIVPFSGARPTIGTFHSTAVRFLRRWADRLGYTSRFVIYDTADQLALVKRSLRELGFDEDRFTPRSVLSRISNAKNELQGPEEFARQNNDFFGSKIAEAYRIYQKGLRTYDAMDFDDLIGNWVKLLGENPDVREQHLARYRHLLIDEYQDTNHAQYALAKLLVNDEGNIVAVGDEDQSIYRFRGANIDNILNFERDFPGATVVKLEQNYRSTGNILDAAIGVVSNNVARKGKTLFTEDGRGEPVRVVSCETERDEARFVIGEIARIRGDVPPRECAVLFRTNAQSRPFEEELLERNMPYTVVGGVRFYDRAEVKDVLAYLRLIVRPHDTPSLERIINTPSRGIGDATWKALEAEAEKEGISVSAVIDGELGFLAERARKAVREFRETIDDLRRAVDRPLPDLVDYVVLRSGYRKALLASRDPQDEARLENIGELVSSAREFTETHEAGSIADWLDTITLMADVDSWDGEKGVTLMTLHAAKGLEFRVVFLAGMEEGILPHGQSLNDYGDIEEERRLCYVGMTRARERLYCLHCFQRRLYGQTREQQPSPFLDEIPGGVREEVRLGSPSRSGAGYGGARMPYRDKPAYRSPAAQPSGRGSSRPAPTSSTGNVMNFFQNAPVRFDPNAIRAAEDAESSGASFRRGTRVRHEKFGAGVILQIEGQGDKEKLTIFFDKAGKKTLLTKIAKLEKA